MFHPAEQGTFFAVTDSESSFWPIVHELKSTVRGCEVSRTFTYSHPDMIAPLQLNGMRVPSLDVRCVDDRGTFQLLRLYSKDTDELYHCQCWTFNILTKSFSTQSYWTPVNLDPHESESRSGTHISYSSSYIWEGQLIYSRAPDFEAKADPVLVALDQYEVSPLEPFPKGLREEFQRDLQISIQGGLDDVDGKRMDVVRHDVITMQRPSAPDYRAVFGFQYACQSIPYACTYKGRHKSLCQSGTASSTLHSTFTPLAAFRHPYRHFQETTENPRGCIPQHLYVDDDFIVSVNTLGYMIYCVDAGGNWPPRCSANCLRKDDDD